MEKHWLKNYPDGVPHDVHPEQYRSLTQLLEESFKKNASRPFSVCMERWMTYGQLDELSAALGAWLQAPEAGTGRARRHHAAQYAAVRGDHGGRAARGLHLREREPAVHGSRARTPAQGFGRHRDRDPGEFREDTRRSHRQHRRSSTSSWLRWATCWASCSARWITFAVRHLAKMVPAYKLPLTAGARSRLSIARSPKAPRCRSRRARRPWIRLHSCNTPAEPRACPRARC